MPTANGPDGNYELRPATRSVRSLKGFFGAHDGPPVTVEEMDAAIADAVTEQ